MSDILSQPLTEAIRPDYTIHQYTDSIYKVVKFRSTAARIGLHSKDHNHYDKKLDSSLSRARRVVLELALCNTWNYFCTFTISKDKFNRQDLAGWYKKFSQWLRDQRKKYPDLSFSYVLVPEQHKDGSWHAHGLFSDISGLLVSFDFLASQGVTLPFKLLNKNYFNWSAYEKKFGFCSFAPIRDRYAVSFYIVKYLNKQLSDTAIGLDLNLYYCSQGLNRSLHHGDIYGHCAYLDQFLTNNYDFCSTGMTTVKDGCTWNFAFEYMDLLPFDDISQDDQIADPDVDTYMDCLQEVLEGFS